jgi:hypothetical protein
LCVSLGDKFGEVSRAISAGATVFIGVATTILGPSTGGVLGSETGCLACFLAREAGLEMRELFFF